VHVNAFNIADVNEAWFRRLIERRINIDKARAKIEHANICTAFSDVIANRLGKAEQAKFRSTV
jgi:hypothetical protein